ncbi:MAG: flagellar basal body rod protein FlgC [Terriglobales bacterium]
MNLFGALDISGSALAAERERAEVVASNLANADSTRGPGGGPYRRHSVIFASTPVGGGFAAAWGGGLSATAGNAQAEGVRVAAVVTDTAPAREVYEPGNPLANAQGYVAYPDINPVEEMADLMGAARSYQFDLSAVQASKNMITESLQILA